jgi:two-component system, response regulator
MKDLKIIEILIVEDNPSDAELTVRALKKNNLANNMFVVEDGQEAIDFLFCKGKYSDRNIENPPKVILLDLKLPKISGLEVLRMIKSDPRTADIPVVVVTSSQEEPDIKEAYKLNVNSYVVKPVDFMQFVEAMGTLGLYWLLINQPNRR